VLATLSPRRRVTLLAAALAAVVAVVALVVATRPAPPPDGVPVLVVPGYGGDAGAVAALAAALREAGRDVRVVVPPDNGQAPIAEAAAALDRAVERSRAAEVDVVGFSAGGVVARTWAADRDDEGRARRIVTLGSPHHGTALLNDLGAAVEQCTAACADLRPGSALLTRLNAADETPGDAEWVTFWTADDTTVVPPPSATLNGATNIRVQDVCPGRRVTHGGLVTDRAVLRWVVAAAADGTNAGVAGC
jgi:triacylglycerol lipase